MKFFATLFALTAVASVCAAPTKIDVQDGAAGTKAIGAAAGKAANSKAAQAAKAAKAAKAGKGSNNAGSAAASADNSANSTATATADNSANGTATGTQSAASATRTRPCDQGDQSLAAGLNAAVVIGIGQQAAVLTLQNATAAQDFADGQTRLQQFVDTMGLQLQMAQAIADDDSFAQTQLKLLAASQTSQETLVKQLVGGDATTSAATLTQLGQSFLDSTNNAQDGASQALIDCFLPLTAVSG